MMLSFWRFKHGTITLYLWWFMWHYVIYVSPLAVVFLNLFLNLPGFPKSFQKTIGKTTDIHHAAISACLKDFLELTANHENSLTQQSPRCDHTSSQSTIGEWANLKGTEGVHSTNVPIICDLKQFMVVLEQHPDTCNDDLCSQEVWLCNRIWD